MSSTTTTGSESSRSVLRPSWDAYFLDFADVAARRATCPKRAVGAVLVRQNRIIGTGYNGAPPGLPHCGEIGCQKIDGGRCGRAVHAEANALLFATRETAGANIYLTAHPCSNCARLLIAAGITRVVYRDNDKPYIDTQAENLLREATVRRLCRR